MNELNKIIKFTTKAHEGQTYGEDIPYIVHVELKIQIF